MPARFGASGGGVAVAAAGGTPPHMMAFRQPAPAYKVGAAAGPAYGDCAPPARAAFPAAAYGGYSIGGAAVAQETVADDVPAGPPAASAPRERALIPGRSTVGKCDLCSRSRRTVVVCQDGKAYCKVCRLQQTGATKAWHSVAKGANMAVDSDEELVGLCKTCSLPLGESVYFDEEKKATVHGECMAARIMKGAQEGEDARQRAAAQEKRAHREAFDIGWKAERVPSNVAPARKLGCELSSKHGVCCLALEGDTRTLRVTESNETAACVNLEYLSLALNVRRSEGREPLFSLDPLDMVKDPERMMQAKRFEPAWLMGTSAGEVMFQADYYLKELSMGEYDQPVVGMKSCFDFSEAEGHKQEWNAREWFVVRKAEVQLNGDKLLMPCVEMGVEAREVLSGRDGLEDAPLTRPDHPLVKYAEQFTRNFDLIAERKSSVYHLRELAKASVLAKFLVEAEVELDVSWFNLVDWQAVKEAAEQCNLEVPQLWKDRFHSKIGVENGVIQESKEAAASTKNSVYGGVAFGLERMSVSMPARLPTTAMGPLQANTAALLSGLLTAGAEEAVVESVSADEAGMALMYTPVEPMAPQVARAVTVARVSIGAGLAAMPSRMQAARFARTGGIAAKGVDLNLNEFDLSAPKPAEDRKSTLAGNGNKFWADLEEGEDSSMDQQDLLLMKEVFNPYLSDRRDEGEAFVGPDPSDSYLTRLDLMIRLEAVSRQRRLNHFASGAFRIGEAGPLFPSSWTSSIKLASTALPCELEPCLFEDEKQFAAAKATAPVFDETSEDGLRFRIYRHGGLEVRTTTGPDGKEAVRAAFTMGEPDLPAILGWELVTKATLYVSASEQSEEGKQRPVYHVLLETDSGNAIITEKLASGAVTWEEHPRDLAGRTARAKVLKSVDCGAEGAAVEELRRHVASCSATTSASESERKHYAQGAFGLAKGEAQRCPSGVARVVPRTEKAAAEKEAQEKQPKVPAAAQPSPAQRRSRLAALLEAGSDAFGADREVVLAAVQVDGMALRRASQELKADREVVLAAVRSKGAALQFAAEHLRADHEIVLAASGTLPHATEALRAQLGSFDPAEAARLRVGDVVRANFVHDHWFLATVQQDNGDGTYELEWFDGDTRHRVKRPEEMKLMRFNSDLQRYEEA